MQQGVREWERRGSLRRREEKEAAAETGVMWPERGEMGRWRMTQRRGVCLGLALRQLQCGPPAPCHNRSPWDLSTLEGSQPPPACLVIGSHSPGMEPALEPEASMVTRTEVSRGPEPRTTRHTYSPESAGDTWCSRSSEPWVCVQTGRVGRELERPHPTPPSSKLALGGCCTWCLAGRLPPRLCHVTWA